MRTILKTRSPRLTVDFDRESFVFRMPDGIPVYTHYSFLFTALFMTSSLWLQLRLSSLAAAVLLMAIIYLSILAHELGHAVAARAQGARIGSINIGLCGGVVDFESRRGIAMRPIAFAGPLVNFALAGLFCAIWWLIADLLPTDNRHVVMPLFEPGVLVRTAYLAALINLALGIFNLLPAFPLDGGTMLLEILSPRLGQRRAALTVGYCGLVLAPICGIVSVLSFYAGVPVLLLLPMAPSRAAVANHRRA